MSKLILKKLSDIKGNYVVFSIKWNNYFYNCLRAIFLHACNIPLRNTIVYIMVASRSPTLTRHVKMCITMKKCQRVHVYMGGGGGGEEEELSLGVSVPWEMVLRPTTWEHRLPPASPTPTGQAHLLTLSHPKPWPGPQSARYFKNRRKVIPARPRLLLLQKFII